MSVQIEVLENIILLGSILNLDTSISFGVFGLPEFEWTSIKRLQVVISLFFSAFCPF